MTFEVIEGGGEMPEFHKTLFEDDSGRLVIEVRSGVYSATLALPDELKQATKERLEEFFQKVVAAMIGNLTKMRAKDERKQRRGILKKC